MIGKLKVWGLEMLDFTEYRFRVYMGSDFPSNKWRAYEFASAWSRSTTLANSRGRVISQFMAPTPCDRAAPRSSSSSSSVRGIMLIGMYFPWLRNGDSSWTHRVRLSCA